MRKLCLAVAVATLAGVAWAHAQGYPARPITMVVPLAPGGSTDVIGRIMAEGMRASLGQPVIVENTAGAGGTIGVGRVARAAPMATRQHWYLDHACAHRRARMRCNTIC
jgi:tripartite-type tricarboxylate transporter receptor subunit TctC